MKFESSAYPSSQSIRKWNPSHLPHTQLFTRKKMGIRRWWSSASRERGTHYTVPADLPRVKDPTQSEPFKSICDTQVLTPIPRAWVVSEPWCEISSDLGIPGSQIIDSCEGNVNYSRIANLFFFFFSTVPLYPHAQTLIIWEGFGFDLQPFHDGLTARIDFWPTGKGFRQAGSSQKGCSSQQTVKHEDDQASKRCVRNQIVQSTKHEILSIEECF